MDRLADQPPQSFTLGTAVSQGQAWLNLMLEIPEKMNQAAKGQGLAQPTHPQATSGRTKPTGTGLITVTQGFVLLVISWLVHSFLAQESPPGLPLTLLVAAIIGVSVSMIRSLLRRT